jgi:hypothetical protein
MGTPSFTGGSVPTSPTGSAASTFIGTGGVGHTSNQLSAPKVVALSAADMPMNHKVKGAPRKFKGDYSEVDLFLDEYELLLSKCRITNGKEKCNFLRRYCSKSVWRVIEGLDSYYRDDWDDLKDSIRNLYDADHNKHRYTEKDLRDYTRRSRKQKISDLRTFRKYQRRFLRVAGWLREHGKIESKQLDRYFWKGLSSSLKPQIKREIRVRDRLYSPSTVIKMSQVAGIAEDLFCLDRFDADDSDYEDTSDKSDGDAMESTTGSSDDEDYKTSKYMIETKKERKRKSKRRMKKDDSEDDSTSSDSDQEVTTRTKVRFERPRRGRDDKRETRERERGRSQTPMRGREKWEQRDQERALEREGEQAQRQDEIEALVKQMGDLSLKNAEFAGRYARVLFLAPSMGPALEIIARSREAAATTAIAYRPPAASVVSPRSPGGYAGTYPNNVPLNGGQGTGGVTCFGCNKVGHMSKECPDMRALEQQKAVRLDSMGKWVLTSGDNIPRRRGEAIAEAVRRNMSERPKNGSVGLCTIEDSDESSGEYSPESEFDEATYRAMIGRVRNGRWLEKSSELNVLNGERSRKITRDARESSMRKPIVTNAPDGPYKVGPPKRKAVVSIKKKPIDVDDGSKFDGANDDEIMEDIENLGRGSDKEKPKRVVKRSDKTEHPEPPSKMLQRLLDAKFEVRVGDVLEVPKKNLVKELADVFKPVRHARRAEDAPEEELRVNYTGPGLITGGTRKWSLISVDLYYKGKPMRGIVDTGSQVNAMSRSYWDRYMSDVPFEREPGGALIDANGGRKPFYGIAEGCTFTCGGRPMVLTMHIIEGANYDILLGMPWIVDHKISIEQRRDGTYLTMRHTDNDGQERTREVRAIESSENVTAMLRVEDEEEGYEPSQTQRTEPEEEGPRVTKRRKLNERASTSRSHVPPSSPHSLRLTTPPSSLRSEHWFFGTPKPSLLELSATAATAAATSSSRNANAANAPLPPNLEIETQSDGHLEPGGEWASTLRDLTTSSDARRFAETLQEGSFLLRGDHIETRGWEVDSKGAPYIHMRTAISSLIPPHALGFQGYKRPLTRAVEGSAIVIFRPALKAPLKDPPTSPPPPPSARPPREPDREGKRGPSKFKPVTRVNAQASSSTSNTTNMPYMTRSRTQANALQDRGVMSPSPQPVAPMLATLLREHDFAFDVLNRDLVLSRPSSTEAVVGTMDATDLPGFGEYTRKPTFIIRSNENANDVDLIVSTRTNVEQLRHDLDEETRTQQGPFWDVPYSTAPEIRGDVPSTATINEDVQDVGKWLDRVRAIQYLAFVLEHAQQDIQRMQVDDETASCKYQLFSRGVHSGLTIRLATNPQATMVMTLPNRERLHAFDQLPSIASIANIGKPGWYATVSTKFHGNLRLTERVHRGDESVTGQDVVWNNGYMAVVAGYVDANGNYRDGQTVSDEDEDSERAESENAGDEIAHPEAVPWWRTNGQLDFARPNLIHSWTYSASETILFNLQRISVRVPLKYSDISV